MKRDNGQAYVGVTNKQVQECKFGPCECKNECYDKVGLDEIKLLFDSYWAMKSHDLQSKFIRKWVTESDAKCSRLKEQESHSKKIKDHAVSVDNTVLVVRRVAF